MPNQNYETYNGENIATYTDEITTQNSFTAEQIKSYALSAGVAPWFTNTASVITGRYTHESATGDANDKVPFFKESNSQILWYDESALAMLPETSLYRYKHCVYITTTGNGIATDLKIDNYKNVLTIQTDSYQDINGEQVKFYSPVITTYYGTDNDYTSSALKPSFLYTNTNDIMGGQSVGSTISVSRWWWGGENDTGNDLWGANGFDRNLQYGTDMGGHEAIPWELCGTPPIRISEGGEGATFPCRFDNDHLTWAFYGNNPLQLLIGLNNINDCLLLCAFCGLKFEYNGTMYKPLASGGVIYGYTNNMSKKSEWDNWHNINDHVIPLIPPTPPAPDNDDIEVDMPLAYIGGTAGMVNFIKINSAGLASADDISDALSRFDITTIGKDLLRNFVSFKCFAVLDIDDSVTDDIKVSGHVLKDGNDNALQGQYIGGLKPIDFSAGKIDRYYGDYRDYEPYTKLEMYVPFCGWFGLPSWCIGKEITGTMFTDLYNGTVKAVIYASRTVVAEVGGCCAYDIPFVADATGSKAGAVISSALSTAAATAATIAVPNIASGIAAVTSAANTISAANGNSTTLKGVMGDGSNLNGLLHVYLKVTRPQSPTRNKEIPDSYKHEYGIPCFKELTLTSGDGYTQILDANITGNMTDREKQMIIDGFRHGLIL